MIRDLPWDTAFFGRKFGRLLSVPTDDLLPDLLTNAAREGYAYLSCRLPASDITAVQLFERHGFYLSDISITWTHALESLAAQAGDVREATAGDHELLTGISRGIFAEGRFYHDPFFSREEADRLYSAWAGNLLSGLADVTFVAAEKGFIGCKMTGGAGDIPLVGVASGSQGKGFGTALMRRALHWFKEHGAAGVTVRTQAGNAQAVRFYEKCGFTVKTMDLTMAVIITR